MALQVWLPLNGTLENKGLSNVTVTNNGATVDNNGKIGKCYSFNSTCIKGSCPGINNLTDMSICCWGYLTNISTPQYFMHFGGQNDYKGKITMNYDGSIRVTINGTGYATGINLSTNTWHHLALTVKGTKAIVYVNGTNRYEATISGSFSASNNFCIGARTANSTATAFAYYITNNGKINDVRLYDHALSAKEVKEISKGLILHYKLDGNDIGITIPRNGGLIPDGVELYDYILSSGTLYIDTGLKTTANTKYVATVKLTAPAIDAKLLGAYSPGAIIATLSGKWRIFANQAFYLTDIATNTDKVDIEYFGNKFKVNSTIYTLGGSMTASNVNIYLFEADYLGGPAEGYLIMYRYQHYEGTTLVRNMLPCTFLGEPGMWDTVENKFYRNQGTGLFTLGNKITLKEYEYLLSDKNAYINTGVILNTVDSEVNIKYLETSITANTTILGSQVNSSPYVLRQTFYRAGTSNSLSLYNSNLSTIISMTAPLGIIEIKSVIDSSNNCKAWVNGTLYQKSFGSSSALTVPLYVFANDIDGSASLKILAALYYLQISKSNQLVRDFVPVSYNGTPGLWDKVEWKFYANAGSGSFTLGPEKTVQQDAPIFYDSSGYCNHGSITGTLTTNSDSPRYTASTTFNSSSRITSNNINLPGTSLFTISCWVYRTGSQNYLPPFWLGNGSSSLGIAIHGTATSRIEGGNGTNRFDNTGSTDVPVNTWTHLVLVYNGSNVIEYLNGSQVNSIAHSYGFGSTLVRMYVGYFWGASFTGRLSDVRLYATALSEDDVKELYNTSAFVTDSGIFAEYELYEDNLSDVKKRGLLETADFYENGAESGYALDTDKTRVASNYIISEEFIEI